MGNVIFSSFVDEHGNEIERTPSTHPYSHEGFVTWRNSENEEANDTVYSDRLLKEDYKLTRKLMKKYFEDQGDYYGGREPKDIEAFLCERLGMKIKLIFIMEYCNQSSGYPYWRFDFKKIK